MYVAVIILYINNNTYHRFAGLVYDCLGGERGHVVGGENGAVHNIFNTYGLTTLPS